MEGKGLLLEGSDQPQNRGRSQVPGIYTRHISGISLTYSFVWGSFHSLRTTRDSDMVASSVKFRYVRRCRLLEGVHGNPELKKMNKLPLKGLRWDCASKTVYQLHIEPEPDSFLAFELIHTLGATCLEGGQKHEKTTLVPQRPKITQNHQVK